MLGKELEIRNLDPGVLARKLSEAKSPWFAQFVKTAKLFQEETPVVPGNSCNS